MPLFLILSIPGKFYINRFNKRDKKVSECKNTRVEARPKYQTVQTFVNQSAQGPDYPQITSIILPRGI